MKIDQNTNKLNPTVLLKELQQKTQFQKDEHIVFRQKHLANESNIQKNGTLFDGMKTILTELFEDSKNTKSLLNLAKNSSIFKTFEYFGNEAKKLNLLLEGKNIINSALNNSLKSLFLDGGHFDETKIKQILEKTILSSEVKNGLLSLQESGDKELQQQATKMITQIDYYQLSSYLNGSLYTFLPFDWDSFEGGDIEFKEEGGKQFTCNINLELKEYGMVKINLLYDEENHISIGFFLENDSLKGLMQENLHTLRRELKESSVFVQNISLIDLKMSVNDDKINLFSTPNQNLIDFDIMA